MESYYVIQHYNKKHKIWADLPISNNNLSFMLKELDKCRKEEPKSRYRLKFIVTDIINI
jgi:hypothetical protein